MLRTVAAFGGVRFLAQLYLRFPYVFLTSISRGLGVDLETLTLVLGLRELSGVASPAVGAVVDRGHLRRTLLVAGVVAGTACAAAAVGGPWWFAATMVVGGLAKVSIDLAQNAWMGHALPLDRRSRLIGWVEASWAMSFLLGVPVLAWCIDTWGWRAAFWVTGPALALASVLTTTGRSAPTEVGLLPGAPDHRDGTDPHDGADPHDGTRVEVVHRAAPRHRVPQAWAVMVFVFTQPMAQMLVFAVNGDWFATGLGLSTTEIGTVAVALGVAELLGTLATVALAVRLGQARCGTWALALTVPALLLLPFVADRTVAGVVTMFVFTATLEFSFVSVLPLITELDPERRGRAMSRAMVVITVARAAGSPIAGWIYVHGGIGSIGVCAAAVSALGAVALALGSRERRA